MIYAYGDNVINILNEVIRRTQKKNGKYSFFFHTLFDFVVFNIASYYLSKL